MKFTIVMYATILIIAISIAMPIFNMHTLVMDLFQKTDYGMVKGILDMSSYDLAESQPIELVGEWYAYEGVYLEEDVIDSSSLGDATMESLPKASLAESQGTYTYQAYVKFYMPEDSGGQVVIAIPYVTNTVSVYLNGSKLQPKNAFSELSESGGSLLIYPISTQYDSELTYQEILVSVNEDPDDTQLYNRIIVIAELQNLLTKQAANYLIEGLLVGCMIAIVIVAVMFMGLMPSYSPLTFMNLFDIMLMTHILFSMSTLPHAFWTMFQQAGFGDVYYERLDLFFLMAAGAIGNELAMLIWDPQKIAPKIFRLPTVVLYGIAALFVTFFPFYVNTVAIIVLLLLLTWTVVGVIITFTMNYRKGNMDFYRCLHFAKTVYLGFILLVDIVTTNSANRPEIFMLIAYIIFLLSHLLIRAYEYKLPYIEARKLNESLEQIVEERTSDLVAANEVLRSLNEKDSLTGAYNRLYFEEEILQILEEFQQEASKIQSLYLCIFDLDNFKLINDNYGHLVGDEQLIEVVKMAQGMVGEHVRVSRIGGEEFTILFIDRTDDEVLQSVEEIRYCLDQRAKKAGRTTGSFGICKATKQLNRKGLFSHADECLYQAKGTGKNKIVYNFRGEAQEYHMK